MHITRIILPGDFVPGGRLTAGKAALRVTDLVIRHLREKNGKTKPNPFGLPKTNYWDQASDTVQHEVNGNSFTVSIGTDSMEPKAPAKGVDLHYHGGTVRPRQGKKALAIPIDPTVAGIWPSEYDPNREKLFKTPAGALGDKETGKILYMLLPSVTIPADPTVLPTDDEIFNATTLGVGELYQAE